MKTVLKVVGVAALATTLFAFKKKNDYTKVINEMDFKPDNISNVRLNGPQVLFDLAVRFTNRTDIDFDVFTAGVISLKKIRVFINNTYIGEANSNMTEISIPAYSSIVVQKILVASPMLQVLSELTTFENLNDFKNIKLEVVVEALGEVYVLEQPLQL
ncbi:hypothetical protein FLJC2902T_17640 [Flavobacterium limnosediminis JC2902]|uniref:Late embryogenesis abundant protein LEA-2 subgroup domain-containing protein n=1 Tax=Flavobacterium limnosediminis JC2902 TaxID=1341181 RepID=V6SPM5_9FLAO|nr:hypothetical protein [Flavobacterium limnosediminis]ESU28404.1 hypothetical protein FLJC2902T_17640 [Flavobacterium limnosediminis JC2902]